MDSDPDPYHQTLVFLAYVGLFLILALGSGIDAFLSLVGHHRVSSSDHRTPRVDAAVDNLILHGSDVRAVIISLQAALLTFTVAFTLWLTRGLGVEARLTILVTLLVAGTYGAVLVPQSLVARFPALFWRIMVPFDLVFKLLQPIVHGMRWLLRPLVGQTELHSPYAAPVTEDALRELVQAGGDEGRIEQTRRDMFEGIFIFKATLVREIMAPRVDIIAVSADDKIDQALELVLNHGHSRIPVYDDSIDHIVGLIYAKDILRVLHRHDTAATVASLMRSVHFVPETLKVEQLLKDMQQRRVHMAIVVDEYGGTAGLITIEDVLEEIVGDIRDEYDTHEEVQIRKVTEYEYLVNALVPIYDVSTVIGIPLEMDGADRIGGLIYQRLDRVPVVGDTVQLEKGVEATVVSMHGARPHHLRIVLRPEQPEDMSDDAEQPESEMLDSSPQPLHTQQEQRHAFTRAADAY